MNIKEEIEKLFAEIDETDQTIMGLFIGLNVDLAMLGLDKAELPETFADEQKKAWPEDEVLQDMKRQILKLGSQCDIMREAIAELKELVSQFTP